MAYNLSNKCAKNLCKRTVLLQLIIKSVVTCFFFEHSVVVNYVAVCQCHHITLAADQHTTPFSVLQ